MTGDSQIYDKLEKTAQYFIDSCRPSPAGSNIADADAILSRLDHNFRIDWGHKTFVAATPSLQGHKTGIDFVAHLNKMAPGLDTWSIDVEQILVDVKKRTVVVRADFFMVPEGTVPAAERTVLNDIILLLTMDEKGEKLIAATEFVDPAASAQIGKWMAANKPDYL